MRIPSLILLILCVFGSSAFAQHDPPLRTISVSGTVETKTAPDRIVWSLQLRDTDMDMRKAKEKNDANIEAIIALCEKLDIGDGDIETSNVSIYREYERDQGLSQGEFKHFVVNRGVTIRQHDLKRFDEYLDAFVSSAEMEVNFSFESSKIQEIRAETRLQAVQMAKDKAEAMANAVGAKLGKVLSLEENAPAGPIGMSNSMTVQSLPASDLATDRFIPGAMRVQVTVHATFELE